MTLFLRGVIWFSGIEGGTPEEARRGRPSLPKEKAGPVFAAREFVSRGSDEMREGNDSPHEDRPHDTPPPISS